MDGETNYLLGRAFARVLGELRGKPTSELRIGLGRDMRLQAPEMARRLRDGIVAEGATAIDAGMVGTEMLYFLVGSQELDGGAMVTASHNPKAYTGVKLVREGALALSGDAGIGEIRDLDHRRHARCRRRRLDRGRRRLRRLSPPRALVHRPGEDQAPEGRRRRRQRHGRADGRPAARAPRPRSGRDLLGTRRRVPRSRAEPAAARESSVRDRPGPRRGRRPRHRLGR